MLPRLTLLTLAAIAAARGVGAQQDAERAFELGGVSVLRVDGPSGAEARMQRPDGTWFALRTPDDRLRFRVHSFDPLIAKAPWRGELSAPADTRLFVVQFHTQVLPSYRDALRAAGVEILHFVPANALCVRVDAERARSLRDLPCVRSVSALANACKLDERLHRFVARIDADAMDLHLVLARKSDRARLVAQVGELGGEVVHDGAGSTMMHVRLQPLQLRALLRSDTVVWVDLHSEASVDMDNARLQGGATYIETFGGYRGEGIRAEIGELFENDHVDFSNVVGRVLERSAGALNHGHCTAGIVGASGASNPLARGLMDMCTLIDGGYYSSLDHFSQIQGSVAAPWNSMLVTASWGAAATPNYDSNAQALDDALFTFDLVRTQSQSNTGTQSSRPEAWAKNVIAVGALNHGDNADPSDDSWDGDASIGPAEDGRIKPDLVGYNEAIFTSDRSGGLGYNAQPSPAGDSMSFFGGTSGATPMILGFAGLVQEMYTDGLFGNALPMPATAAHRFENRPHMTTARALLCNTAAQYDFSGTQVDLARAHQGWGFPSLQRLYDNRDQIVVLDEYDVLQVGEKKTWLVYLEPQTPEFRVTMIYNDPAGNPAMATHLVNDLDLRVTRYADGVSWWGNHGLHEGTASTPGGSADTVDNVECVYLPNPDAGLYLVEVTAASIVQDAHVETPQVDADFALVMHPMGGGYRSTQSMTLTLDSSAPGDLQFDVSNVPATGWTDGFTMLSFDAGAARGFGDFFGMQLDGLSRALWTVQPTAGDLFHFTSAPGGYPFQPMTFPDPGLVSVFSGQTLDAMVVLLDGPQVAGVSNVARITLQ